MDILKIITGPYRDLCTRQGCSLRIEPSQQAKCHRALITTTRLLFIVVCSMFVGAHWSLLVHAQTTGMIPIQVSALQQQASDNTIRLATLEAREINDETRMEHAESEIATQHGINIGMGAVLGLLQAIQMVLKRNTTT